MINLLPDIRKKQIQAARSNVLLIRYSVAMIFVVIALGGAIFVTNFLLTTLKEAAVRDAAENVAKVTDFGAVQAQASQFRTNLSKAKTLFDTEIKYSEIIARTANLLPAGTALETLTLDEDTLDKPMVLNVRVSGEAAAVALRNAFQSSGLYTNVSYGKLTTNNTGDANVYPYNLELNVTLNRAARPSR